MLPYEGNIQPFSAQFILRSNTKNAELILRNLVVLRTLSYSILGWEGSNLSRL
jgi:hypothetical protein